MSCELICFAGGGFVKSILSNALMAVGTRVNGDASLGPFTKDTIKSHGLYIKSYSGAVESTKGVVRDKF